MPRIRECTTEISSSVGGPRSLLPRVSEIAWTAGFGVTTHGVYPFIQAWQRVISKMYMGGRINVSVQPANDEVSIVHSRLLSIVQLPSIQIAQVIRCLCPTGSFCAWLFTEFLQWHLSAAPAFFFARRLQRISRILAVLN